jgi:electron transfer flavoprotein alpha subunit
VTVLCLVELDGTGAADASLRALTFAREVAGPGGPLAVVVFGEADALAGGAQAGEALAAYGASDAYVIEPGQLDGYAPLALARVLAGLVSQTGAAAVLAAGTDRGSEVMAHLGALAGLPMAANCVSAARSGPGPDGAGTWQIVRQRWAGLLLEDAVLEGSPALATVATDTVAPAPADAPATLTVHAHQPELADGDLAVRATESATRSGGVSLATARVVVAGAVPGLRHQRRDPAHRRLCQRQAHRRGQLRPHRADPQPCRVRGDRRPAQGDPRAGGRDQGPRRYRLTRGRPTGDLWPS